MKRIRGEDGFTLIELMVVSALSMIIVFSGLSLLEGATRAERGTQSRYDTVLALRQAMTDTTKMVRQATAVSSSSTPSSLVMDTLVDGAPHHVIFDVVGGNYRLTDTTAGITGHILVPRFTAVAAFCYDPPGCTATSPSSPTSIQITLAGTPDVSAGGPISLTSNVDLRNIH